jgi:hypothetical protein
MAMTLNDIVLQKLSEWRSTGEGRQVLVVPGERDGCFVSVTADRQDALSCALWELTLQRPAAAPDASDVGLEAWAEQVATHATGLLEPLEVVEIDRQRHEALLRSKQPRRRGNQLYYYEVLLKGIQEALLRRFQASVEGLPRQQVPFLLTHEAIAKVAADLNVLV